MSESLKQRSTSQLAPIEHFLGMDLPIPDDVYRQMVTNSRNILNFGALAPEPYRAKLAQQWEERIAQVAELQPERFALMQEAQQTLTSIPTLKVDLSQRRLNPKTVWEGRDGNRPDIFFGMGGGSQSILRAVTLEALVMFLTAEAVRRKLNLGKVRAIHADRITWTNLPYSPDFLPPSINQQEVLRVRNNGGPQAIEAWPEIQIKINQRMAAERNIYQMIITRLGFPTDQWDLFLHSDIAQIIDAAAYARYNQTTTTHAHILTSLTGLDEYHYAMEDGIIDALVNGHLGGVKVGWHIRDMDDVHGGYIMDEQPFHARYMLGEALREDSDEPMRTSFVYALAAPLLYSDAHGNLRKASPYICYDPENMLTLHPDDNVYEKLRAATLSGGGLRFEYSIRFWSGLVRLYEELTNTHLSHVKVVNQIVDINSVRPSFPGERLALKIKAMKDALVYGIEDEIRQQWVVFEQDTPKASDGLPMRLTTSKFYELLGIQPPDLYYRIKAQTYDDSTFGELATLYQGDVAKINLTRDLLILAALTHEKVWTTIEESEQTAYFSPLILGNDSIQQIYHALQAIGVNTGIAILSPDHPLYKNRLFQPDEALLPDFSQDGKNPFCINSEVAEEIAQLDSSRVQELCQGLEQFLTIVSYPNTKIIKQKAEQFGIDLSGLADEDLRTLQSLAEDFFEARAKGSTPRLQWRQVYYKE